ncbi:MAG: hypothetical protein COT25_03500 [Candidatus Kerfeldbacteria bacterium CG08_land_8_20_14_0_20_42_7]|uniref:Vitamin K epoxide reductase domain-containing protein n=1 Tax=Candidatus Kerfeldbacteria bacterium CG08_land_8_20_14_0_20_42_7 TaxID=2014245 RepID=A0A2H0YUE0_9BACT|nr:MAG: hypothetical protein COT25_03500 [Candidatus Kerfeldbacteria bacterium CG08_land_8_20_14_0_20_42_7]
MKAKHALLTIMIISIVGMLFSGYLSYGELFKDTCNATSFAHCGTWSFADLPACVYGLVMYTVVFIVSLLGFCQARKSGVQEINTTK